MADLAAAYIALGANLGDRLAALKGAIEALDAADGVRVLAVSGLYQTAPVGGPGGQGAFLNAAAKIETTLAPLTLLDLLLDIERRHNRERVVRWGPRTLDLDLLLHGEEAFSADRLTVPHPRMHERRFVLAPLADVGADAILPTLGKPVAALLAALPEDDRDDVVRVEETWT